MTAQDDFRFRVFVHLAYGFGENTWHKKMLAGRIVGINEDLAYGYHRARRHNCELNYSTDHAENMFRRIVRYAMRFILGFDIVHAFANRASIRSSDIVWTHTESQYLAVLLLTRWWRKRPKIIAQTVWLMDRWSKLPVWRKLFYKALMERADVLTFHSPLNLATAQRLFPANVLALVRFGIRSDDLKCRPPRCPQEIKLLSVGNDRDRDWPALLAATAGWERCSVRIASATCRANTGVDEAHAVVAPACSNQELFHLYDWADVVLVTLKRNDHASGLTAIQEAIARGVPVIASKVGGLEAYFSKGEVLFIEDNRPDTIRHAIDLLMKCPQLQVEMAAGARALMQHSLNSESYALAHVHLSRQVLSQVPTYSRKPTGPIIRESNSVVQRQV